MPDLVAKTPSFDDVIILKLAREIAMDIRPLDVILETYELDFDQYETLTKTPAFQGYLRNAIEEWQSATNTPERVRLKSLSFVEEALPEFYARAHDRGEPLSAKVELLKTVARFGGVGGQVESAGTGERMVVTINLGADQTLKIEKDITPAGNVIEGSAVNG